MHSRCASACIRRAMLLKESRPQKHGQIFLQAVGAIDLTSTTQPNCRYESTLFRNARRIRQASNQQPTLEQARKCLHPGRGICQQMRTYASQARFSRHRRQQKKTQTQSNMKCPFCICSTCRSRRNDTQHPSPKPAVLPHPGYNVRPLLLGLKTGRQTEEEIQQTAMLHMPHTSMAIFRGKP